MMSIHLYKGDRHEILNEVRPSECVSGYPWRGSREKIADKTVK